MSGRQPQTQTIISPVQTGAFVACLRRRRANLFYRSFQNILKSRCPYAPSPTQLLSLTLSIFTSGKELVSDGPRSWLLPFNRGPLVARPAEEALGDDLS